MLKALQCTLWLTSQNAPANFAPSKNFSMGILDTAQIWTKSKDWQGSPEYLTEWRSFCSPEAYVILTDLIKRHIFKMLMYSEENSSPSKSDYFLGHHQKRTRSLFLPPPLATGVFIKFQNLVAGARKGDSLDYNQEGPDAPPWICIYWSLSNRSCHTWK